MDSTSSPRVFLTDSLAVALQVPKTTFQHSWECWNVVLSFFNTPLGGGVFTRSPKNVKHTTSSGLFVCFLAEIWIPIFNFGGVCWTKFECISDKIRRILFIQCSNFRITDRTLACDFKNAFRIVEKYHAEARSAEATSYDFSESTNWRCILKIARTEFCPRRAKRGSGVAGQNVRLRRARWQFQVFFGG